jgi:4-amino-4-deoxy-L-arabinose transferase-like glycosyltransferase
MRGSKAWLSLLGIWCITCLWNLWVPGIFDLDEGLYSQAAREMLITGDWVTPRVNRTPFYEKPPLAYWVSAGGQALFGQNPFGVRIGNAAAVLIACLLVFAWGRRRLGETTSWAAAAVLLVSPLVFAEARILTMDALLMLCVTAAVILAWEGTHRTGGPCRMHITAAWGLCGLGVLAKGAPGIVLPGAALVLHALTAERWKIGATAARIRPLLPVSGLLLFAAVAVPWHLLAWKAGGDPFVQEYLIRQHIGRFQGGDTAHRAPFWFYVPATLLLFYPWSFLLPSALRWRTEARQSELQSMLKCWALVVFLLFSAGGSKLVSYVLPMYPPLALLTTVWIRDRWNSPEARRAQLWSLYPAMLLAMGLLFVMLNAQPILQRIAVQTGRPVPAEQVTPQLLSFGLHLAVAAVLASAAGFVLVQMHRRREALWSMGLGMLLFAAAAAAEGIPAVDSALLKPWQNAAKTAGAKAQTDEAIVLFSGSPRRPSGLFYLPSTRFTGASAPVVETTDLKETLAAVARYGHAVVVAATPRANNLALDEGSRLLLQGAQWSVVRLQSRSAQAPHNSR